MRAWIDIGSPDAARLHKASKAAPRVAVYMHKDPANFLRQLAGERIHRSDSLELLAIDRELLDALVSRLDRRVAFDLSVTDGDIYLTVGGETVSGRVQRYALAGAK